VPPEYFAVPFLTDERLKSYLDTNQLIREQMCVAVLSIDKRFTEVRPRHPRGGPDGGRDIEAMFRHTQRAFGAVGFVNQANDSDEQKSKIKKKFGDDLSAAAAVDPKPQVFVFFTNINLTIGEKDALKSEAKSAGFIECDIFDRERLRISLDDTDGFSIRFQYLGLSLSDAEQASFFARWGDDIHSMISTGFQSVQRTLDRVLFLQEAADVLGEFTVFYELDREYDADEIGHFRAFFRMHLKEVKHDILWILFGSCDKADRTSRHRSDRPEMPGIRHGISGGQWESYLQVTQEDDSSKPDPEEKYQLVASSSGIGMDKVRFIRTRYSHDDFIRLRPRLVLKDTDAAMIMPILNLSLAEKLKAIHIYANGYKLMDIQRRDFSIDLTPSDHEIPVEFSVDELRDP
jgi:hypothetical protein